MSEGSDWINDFGTSLKEFHDVWEARNENYLGNECKLDISTLKQRIPRHGNY
jgi:hypothetical protein